MRSAWSWLKAEERQVEAERRLLNPKTGSHGSEGRWLKSETAQMKAESGLTKPETGSTESVGRYSDPENASMNNEEAFLESGTLRMKSANALIRLEGAWQPFQGP